jgi:hypothetical protein
MPRNKKNLYYFDKLSDDKVGSDYFDVIGWEVVDSENRTIGKVDHLLINKKAQRVVYLDVEVDDSLIEDRHDTFQTTVSDGVREFINKDGETHLIIPIGMAHLDETNKKISTSKIDFSTFANAKRHKKGDDIDFGYELTVLRHFVGDHAVEENSFYDREEFDVSKIRNKI